MSTYKPTFEQQLIIAEGKAREDGQTIYEIIAIYKAHIRELEKEARSNARSPNP